MPRKKEENILRDDLFGDKIIENCFKIDTTHYNDNDLLLRQETKKIACPGSWYNNNKKKLIGCLKLKGCILYRMCSKWPPLRLSL